MKPNPSKSPASGREGFYRWLSEGLGWRYRRLISRLRTISRSNRRAGNGYITPNGGYDAAKYWADRHKEHLHSFRGVGDLSRSEAQNIADYVAAAGVMAELLQSVGCAPRGKALLDIGCGNGFWAGVFARWGIRSYTGVDITDALFPLLQRRYPEFRFIAGDFLQIPLHDGFQIITIIDVTQHIVDDARLEHMLARARSLLAEDGVLIVTFWNQVRAQENFYEKFRMFDFYTRALGGLAHTQPIRFRDKFISAFYDGRRRPDGASAESLPRAAVLEVAEQILRP